MVMVLLALVAGIAMAQVMTPVVQCNQYNQQTARLQQENQTALVPALTFACTVYNQLPNSGVPIQSGTLYDWQVIFPTNAPLTSSTAIIGDETEPMLTVDVVPSGGVSEFAPNPLPEFFALPVSPANTGGIYPGNATSGGAVIFQEVDMNPNSDTSTSALPDTVYITIYGLRVSALQLASNPPNYGGPLVLTVWAKPSQTKNTANQTNPGNIFVGVNGGLTNEQPTISVQLGYAAPSLVVAGGNTLDWRQCFAWSLPGQQVPQYFHVDFTELYSYAFSPPTDWSQTGRTIGWENPTIGGGTRLAFVFSSGGDNNWPSYVTISVPQAIEVLQGNSVIVEAVLVTGTNPDGSGGTVTAAPASPLIGWGSDSGLDYGTLNADGWYYPADTTAWTTVDTSATGNMVVYEILPGATDAVTTTLEVPVQGMLVATPPTPYPPPDDPTAMVTVVMAGYAPWTAGPVPQITPIPRFVMPPPLTPALNLLTIDPCTTNLLYPYLVAGQGWDTGLTVANTGLDPFGSFCAGEGDLVCAASTPAVPGVSANGNDQPGICNVYFYGSFDRGAPLLTDATNPPTPIVLGAKGFNGSATGDDPADFIQPGTTSEDLIQAILVLNYPKTDFTKHSWNGYAIATCDFLYAHGYAFTVYHGTATNGGNLSLGYLALVFDQRGIVHPSQKPEKMTF
jgi:hypothetical protein